MIRYLLNTDKTVNGPYDGPIVRRIPPLKEPDPLSLVSCFGCTSERAAGQFRSTERLWERIRGSDRPVRPAYLHAVQAFGEDDPLDPELAHEIGRELAVRLWAGEHEILLATHCDTSRIHNHFLINPCSIVTGRRIRCTPQTLEQLQKVSDQICMEYGLPGNGLHFDNRLPPEDRRAERENRPTVRMTVREEVDRAVRASLTEREFFRNLRKLGYRMPRDGETGRRALHPGIIPSGSEKEVWFHRLAPSGYSLEEIRARITQNTDRAPLFPEDQVRSSREALAALLPAGKGFAGQWARYREELKIYLDYPASVCPVPYFVREDAARMDKMEQGSALLEKEGIRTPSEAESVLATLESQLDALEAERLKIRDGRKEARPKVFGDRTAQVRKKAAEITEKMRQTRIRRNRLQKAVREAVRIPEKLADLKAIRDRAGNREEQRVPAEIRPRRRVPPDAGRMEL